MKKLAVILTLLPLAGCNAIKHEPPPAKQRAAPTTYESQWEKEHKKQTEAEQAKQRTDYEQQQERERQQAKTGPQQEQENREIVKRLNEER